MILVKKTGKKIIECKWVYYGLFYCHYCESKIELATKKGRAMKSCGCADKKHEPNEAIIAEVRFKKVWWNMIYRCNNKNHKSYYRYGGRGISVCDEWSSDYLSFRRWAFKNGYKKGLTIDRINNDGNYEPSNCRFVTQAENNKNQGSHKHIKTPQN